MLDVTGGELLVLVGAAAIFLGASDVGVGGVVTDTACMYVMIP